MGTRLEGKPVVQFLRDEIKQRVAKLSDYGVVPTMLIIRVGDREDDISYERGILKNCELLGIKSEVLQLPKEIQMEKLIEIIEAANKDKTKHGIMIFRPLPMHLNSEVLSKVISPEKDVDCMSPVNMERVFEGKSTGFVPCTAKAVVELLKYYEIPLRGANVAIIGRSMVVGKPLSMLLLDENSTVTICHSGTKDMAAVTKNADIVVAAIGKAKFMTDEYFSSESIVVDVGINDSGDGKICGDVDFDIVYPNVKAITPAVGGIGTITTTILLSHTVSACEKLMKAF